MNKLVAQVFVVAMVGQSGCIDDATPTAPDAATTPDANTGPTSVAIRFAAKAGMAEFACGETLAGIGAPAAPWTGADLRFFVHDVALTGPSLVEPLALETNVFQRDGLALVDLETGAPGCEQGTSAEHAAVTGTVPPRPSMYAGLRFSVGVPFAMNHVDPSTAAAPLNDTTMWWAWRGGYKFVRVDGQSGDNPFVLHLGSTGCGMGPSTEPPTEPCDNPNVVTVEFPTFNPATDVVVLDIATLFAGVNVATNTAMTAPGCMSAPDDPECAAVFDALGLPLGTVPPAGPQSVFRVEAAQ